MNSMYAGWLALGIPMLLFGLVFLRRQGGVFWMYLAACLLGLGYLTTTGAVSDIGTKALNIVNSASSPPMIAPKTAPAK
ncbi:MAG: hypothetical protein ABL908_03570 [Hyphomicrobium sp.]